MNCWTLLTLPPCPPTLRVVGPSEFPKPLAFLAAVLGLFQKNHHGKIDVSRSTSGGPTQPKRGKQRFHGFFCWGGGWLTCRLEHSKSLKIKKSMGEKLSKTIFWVSWMCVSYSFVGSTFFRRFTSESWLKTTSYNLIFWGIPNFDSTSFGGIPNLATNHCASDRFSPKAWTSHGRPMMWFSWSWRLQVLKWHSISLLLGGGFKYFLFSPLLFAEDFQFDDHIFQMGGKKPPTRFFITSWSQVHPHFFYLQGAGWLFLLLSVIPVERDLDLVTYEASCWHPVKKWDTTPRKLR